MDADQFISNAAAELEMVEAQLRDIEARGAALRARAEGLRFVVRYGQEGSHADKQGSAAALTAVPGTEAVQTDLVLRAMDDIKRAAMTGEIADRVNSWGYDFTHDQIRSALGYLLRKKPPRVERVKPGVWRLPKAATSPASFAPLGTTSLTPAPRHALSANGSRGES